MPTLINETYLDILKSNNIDPSSIDRDKMSEKQLKMAERSNALASSAFTEGVDVLKRAMKSMVPTFLMGKGLHDQLTTILDSVSNQSDLLDYSKTQLELMKQMKKAQKQGDDSLQETIQNQMDALERLQKFRSGPERKLYEDVLNRKSVDSDQAHAVVESAKAVATDLKAVAPIAHVDSSKVVNQMTDRITDRRLGKNYRSTIAGETVGFLRQSRQLKENPQLKDIEKLLSHNSDISEKEYAQIATMLKGYEKVAFQRQSVDADIAGAIKTLKNGNLNERKDAMQGVIKQLSAIPQFAAQVVAMQKAFRADGKLNAHTSKKVANILQKVQADTTDEKIVFNLKELNEKFDESLLDHSDVETGLQKNKLSDRFVRNPGIVAAGKGVASTAISGLLNALGLGNFDAALGLSDGIVGGLGAAGSAILAGRAARKGAARGAAGTAEGAARGGSRLGRAAKGVGRFATGRVGKMAAFVGAGAGAIGSLVGLRRGRDRTDDNIDAVLDTATGEVRPRNSSSNPHTTVPSSSRTSAPSAGEPHVPSARPKPATRAGKLASRGVGLARAGGKVARMAGRGMLSGASKLLGPIGIAAMAAYDGFDGWNNASDIAGLKPGQEATFGQKSQAALSSIASGLSFGLIDTKDIYAGLDKVTNVLGPASKFVTDTVAGGLDKASKYMEGFTNDMMTGLSKGWDTVTTWGTEGWKSVQDLASGTLDSVTKLGTNMLDTAKDYLGEGGLKGAIFGPTGIAIGAAIDFFSNPNRIADMVQKAKDLATRINPMNWFDKEQSVSSPAEDFSASPNIKGQAIPVLPQPGTLDQSVSYQGSGSGPLKGQATLATRNFNPGNIRASDKNQWVGEVGQEGGFEKFDTVVHGARAWFKLARKHVSAEGMTLKQLVNKLTPPNENDTSGYVTAVSKETGIDPNQKLDPNDQPTMMAIAKAVFRQEGYQGQISDIEMLDAWNGTENNQKYSKDMKNKVDAAISTSMTVPKVDTNGKIVTPLAIGKAGPATDVPVKGAAAPTPPFIPGITPLPANTVSTPAANQSMSATKGVTGPVPITQSKPTDPAIVLDPLVSKGVLTEPAQRLSMIKPVESSAPLVTGEFKSLSAANNSLQDVGSARSSLNESKSQLQTAQTAALIQTQDRTTNAVKEQPAPQVVQSGGGGSNSGNGTTKAAKNIDDIMVMMVNNSSF
ncbi:endolysin [Pseudomonas phage vB_PpuM-SKa-4]